MRFSVKSGSCHAFPKLAAINKLLTQREAYGACTSQHYHLQHCLLWEVAYVCPDDHHILDIPVVDQGIFF